MGDVSAEPSMEDILSSIKRIIAEDGDAAPARARRAPRAATTVPVRPAPEPGEVLELNELAPAADDDEDATPEELVSPVVAEASRGSLDALTRMITRGEPEAALAADGSPSMEAFVGELLRPLLREWLDAHLPELVEAMVAKEIARITGNR